MFNAKALLARISWSKSTLDDGTDLYFGSVPADAAVGEVVQLSEQTLNLKGQAYAISGKLRVRNGVLSVTAFPAQRGGQTSDAVGFTLE